MAGKVRIQFGITCLLKVHCMHTDIHTLHQLNKHVCAQEGYKKSNMTSGCTLACTCCHLHAEADQSRFINTLQTGGMRLTTENLFSQHIAAQLQQHIMQRQDLLLYC